MKLRKPKYNGNIKVDSEYGEIYISNVFPGDKLNETSYRFENSDHTHSGYISESQIKNQIFTSKFNIGDVIYFHGIYIGMSPISSPKKPEIGKIINKFESINYNPRYNIKTMSGEIYSVYENMISKYNVGYHDVDEFYKLDYISKIDEMHKITVENFKTED